MDNQVYAITNLEGYASQTREAAAKHLSENSEENLDIYISITQIINLIKEKCLGFDDQNRPMLDENINEEIYETIIVWIHNVGLAKLAAQDLVECAWDDKTNEMIFWPKEKKKTKNGKSKKTRRKNMGDQE
jgi:hypothetical protein